MWFSSYSWYISDVDIDQPSEKVEIRGFGFMRSETGELKKSLVRVTGFEPHCYVLFPKFVDQKQVKWTEEQCHDVVVQALKKTQWGYNKDTKSTFKKITSVSTTFVKSHMFTNMLEERFAVKIEFKSISAMKHFSSKLSKDPVFQTRLGSKKTNITLECREDRIDNLTKFFVSRNIMYKDYWTADFELVKSTKQISRLESEYICTAETVVKTTLNTDTWNYDQKYLGFDIETFSDRDGKFPQANNINDAIFIISIWIWNNGESKDLTKKTSLVYGRVNQAFKDDDSNNIEVFDSELSLLERFFEILHDTMPMSITGYNISGFDWKYILLRWKIRTLNQPIPNISYIKDSVVERQRAKPHYSQKQLYQWVGEFDWKSSAYGSMKMKYLAAEGIIALDPFVTIKRENNKLKFYDLSSASSFYNGPVKHDVDPSEISLAFSMYSKINSKHFAKSFIKNARQFFQKRAMTKEDNELFESIRANLQQKYIEKYELLKQKIELDKMSLLEADMASIEYADIQSLTSLEEVLDVSLFEMTRIVNYANRDMECTKYLCDKLDLISSCLELSNIVNISVEENWSRGQQVRGERICYYNCSKRNVIFDKIDKSYDRYKGAYVSDPIPGIYRQIPSVDVSGMYPSIMRAYNIDPSTFVEIKNEGIDTNTGKIRISNQYNIPLESLYVIDTTLTEEEKAQQESKKRKKKKQELSDSESEIDENIDQETKADVTELSHFYGFLKPLSMYYDTSYRRVLGNYDGDQPIEQPKVDHIEDLNTLRRGILPVIIETLIDQRAAVREKMKTLKKTSIEYKIADQKQLNIKICANSFYGMLGAKNGKVQFFEGADAVTGIGRKIIKAVNNFIEQNLGGKIVYNDTDSAKYSNPSLTYENCWELCKKDIKKINDFLPYGIKMELENIEDVIYIKSKHYIYFCIDERTGTVSYTPETIKPKGVCIAKRATSDYLKDFYTTIVIMFMKKVQYIEILLYIVEKSKEIISGDLDLKKIYSTCTYSGVYVNENHQNAVFTRRLMGAGEQIDIGDRIPYVVAFIPDKDMYVQEGESEWDDYTQTSRIGDRMRKITEMKPQGLIYDIRYYVISYSKPIEVLISAAMNNANELWLDRMNQKTYQVKGARTKPTSYLKPLTIVSKIIKHCEYDKDKILSEIQRFVRKAKKVVKINDDLR